jgi:putative spermidine/putrescine transport system permease protein
MRRRVTLSGAVAVVTIAFLVAPFVIVTGASFDSAQSYTVRFPPRDLTLKWYGAIPAKYWAGLEVSVALGAIVALLATILGVMAAFALVRGNLIGEQALRAFFRLPVQIPLVVTGAVFLQFYYYVVAIAGVNPMNGLAGLVLAHLFIAMPYCTGAIAAVMARLDAGLEEAAESLGATPWGTFRQVTFPALRPGIVAGLLYAFIMSFGDVPVSIFLVNSDTMTFPVQAFQDMQADFNPGMLAVSTIVVAVSLMLILLLQKVAGLDLVLPSQRKG